LNSDGLAVLEGADEVFSAEEIRTAIDRVAIRIAVAVTDTFPLVVCVMNGGLPFTAALLDRFEFPLHLDYVHATRYSADEGGDITFRTPLQTDPSGRTVLLIDDVLDAGHTLQAVTDHIRARAAQRVLTAVLVDKPIEARTTQADFVGLTTSERDAQRFLVGWGMDYDGMFRNLSSIYALNLGEDAP
jgi:hypoxanthine phosphoribosyltransferase